MDLVSRISGYSVSNPRPTRICESRVGFPIIIRLIACDYTRCGCSITGSISPIHVNTVQTDKPLDSPATTGP